MEAKKEIKDEKEKIPKKEEEKIEKIARDMVIPGEAIVSGEDYLPGEGTMREGKKIISTRLGLVEYVNRLVKVIPVSGVYIPRRGNNVIGKITDINFNGWQVDISAPYSSFLSTKECFFPRMIRDPEEFLSIGDMITAKVYSIKRKGIDLTMQDRGLHKIEGGMTITINPNKVPRVIGKEGSMVNMIKMETGCNITVGQNGIIWIKGESIDAELFAKDAVLLIAEKAHVEGLTGIVQEFLEKGRKGLKITPYEEKKEEI